MGGHGVFWEGGTMDVMDSLVIDQAESVIRLMKNTQSVVPRYEWELKRDTAYAVNAWARETKQKLAQIVSDDPKIVNVKTRFLKHYQAFQRIVDDLTWAYL